MLRSDPLWYKDAIIYEAHVRAYHDSVGDGFGDFRGLTQKLDYLQDLGVTAVWVLPFYPSPWRDDGYDIADYTTIHPSYGTLKDFQEFLREAHRRDLRVITELVINHTSDQHAWFQRARRAPIGSVERDFYVWSDTPEKYKDVRIIFKDFERSNWTWDPIAKQYYWHRFYSHQPDLNYDNPAVWDAIFPVVDYWFNMGVDAMRLDAIPYLYEREGTSCDGLPETHQFLKALRKHVDERFPDRMFLAEANQWPEDAVAYFGTGDECHMAFHFPLMPRLFMALHMEDRFPITDIIAQTPLIPENCQWCLFLRNHDELTLEMVTDEERDYMVRAYAKDPQARINLGIRRRLAPLLNNDRKRIELMNALLFSLPGTPAIYYGDEIGMGDNIYLGDRNGVRTPMQWSADRNAGFSRANPQKLYLPVIIDPEYHYEAINVEAQQNNPSSLLWWMKRIIALRKQHPAFGRGTFEVLTPTNPKILAFIRRYGEDVILVTANLSRFVQFFELDLSAFVGQVPIELFGRTAFPPIRAEPYLLSLNPHGFCWFKLTHAPKGSRLRLEAGPGRNLPELVVADHWEELLDSVGQEKLESLLPRFIEASSRLRNPNAGVKRVTIRGVVPLRRRSGALVPILWLQIDTTEGLPEQQLLPISFLAADRAAVLAPTGYAIASVRRGTETLGLICDALGDQEFRTLMLDAILAGRTEGFPEGEIRALPIDQLPTDANEPPLSVRMNRTEENNLSLIYGDRFVLKVYRSVEQGPHPEVEIGRFLTPRTDFTRHAPLLGTIELQPIRGESFTLAVLHGFIANQGDAWSMMLSGLSRFFDQVLTLPEGLRTAPPQRTDPIPEDLEGLLTLQRETARKLAILVGDLHTTLARNTDAAFLPESFDKNTKRALYQSMRNQVGWTFAMIRQRLHDLTDEDRSLAQRVLAQEQKVLNRYNVMTSTKPAGRRLRGHGDLHLGQILFTGTDFVLIDFEGNPARSLADRRVKRSPLVDVSGMVRSFQNAALVGFVNGIIDRPTLPGSIRPADRELLRAWAWLWSDRLSEAFIETYLAHPAAELLSGDPATDREMLGCFVLDQAVREAGEFLNMRPDWLSPALAGIERILEQASEPVSGR